MVSQLVNMGMAAAALDCRERGTGRRAAGWIKAMTSLLDFNQLHTPSAPNYTSVRQSRQWWILASALTTGPPANPGRQPCLRTTTPSETLGANMVFFGSLWVILLTDLLNMIRHQLMTHKPPRPGKVVSIEQLRALIMSSDVCYSLIEIKGTGLPQRVRSSLGDTDTL